MFKSVQNRKYDWKDSTLIFPCVSVGNVGQLSVDVIISSLNLEKIGYIYHSAILPVVGSDPYSNKSRNITTAIEVFASEQLKLVVLQQRAPIAKGKSRDFGNWIAEWIKEAMFKQVVLLTSSFAHERLDQQIDGSQLRILMSQVMEEQNGDTFKNKFGWLPLEKRSCVSPYEMDNSEMSKDMIYLPGSGVAKNILNNCNNLQVLILSVFCSEGDNIPEAIFLSNHLNVWLRLVKVGKDNRPLWKIPDSWQLIYGSGFDQTLFH